LDGDLQITILNPSHGTLEEMSSLFEDGSFIYLQTPEDNLDLLRYLEDTQICRERNDYQGWILWFCNGYVETAVAEFEDGMLLDSVLLPDRLDEDNRIILLWRAEKPPRQDYTVFIHLLDADDTLIGQWDQPPGGWSSSTSSWDETHIEFDDYRIPAALNGRTPYRIVVGLYDVETKERLEVLESQFPAGDGQIELRQYPSR
jgi:hypothetical protein